VAARRVSSPTVRGSTLERTSESTAYEVRCQRCNCSFAPGTKRCIHCGEPISPRLRLPLGGDLHGSGPGGPGAGGDEEIQVSATFLRSALWVLSIAIALAMSAFRVCGGN